MTLVIPFGALVTTCRAKGMTVHQYVWDGGETIEVYKGSTLLTRSHWAHGDPDSATVSVALRLIHDGHLRLQDFEHPSNASTHTTE